MRAFDMFHEIWILVCVQGTIFFFLFLNSNTQQCKPRRIKQLKCSSKKKWRWKKRAVLQWLFLIFLKERRWFMSFSLKTWQKLPCEFYWKKNNQPSTQFILATSYNTRPPLIFKESCMLWAVACTTMIHVTAPNAQFSPMVILSYTFSFLPHVAGALAYYTLFGDFFFLYYLSKR